MSQVITANRLRDGTVVFFAAEADWVEGIEAARVFDTAEAAAAGMAATKKDEQDHLVLAVCAIDVTRTDGTLKPSRLREAIRASGPTVHPEHGKQPLQSKQPLQGKQPPIPQG